MVSAAVYAYGTAFNAPKASEAPEASEAPKTVKYPCWLCLLDVCRVFLAALLCVLTLVVFVVVLSML